MHLTALVKVTSVLIPRSSCLEASYRNTGRTTCGNEFNETQRQTSDHKLGNQTIQTLLPSLKMERFNRMLAGAGNMGGMSRDANGAVSTSTPVAEPIPIVAMDRD